MLIQNGFMSDEISSALIGAVIGSVGATFLSNWLSRRGDKQRAYENVVQRYLLQMQDSVDSLWWRLYNLRDLGGRKNMDEKYYEITTLYAFGKVLAFKYIIVVEGVYYNIEKTNPGLGDFLRDQLEAIDSKLDYLNYENNLVNRFYRYDRQTLAESIIQKNNESTHTLTFLEFRRQYNEDSTLKSLLLPAKEFIFSLNRSQVTEIMNRLLEIAKKLQTETWINTTIKNTG